KNHLRGTADLGADGLDQRVVHDAVLPARLPVEQVAESRDPVLAVMGGGPQHRFGDSRLKESRELLVSAQLFDSKIEGIDRVRIDHDGRDAGATEHGGRGRARKSAADDRNVGVAHAKIRCSAAILAPAKANKALSGATIWTTTRILQIIPGYKYVSLAEEAALSHGSA